MTLKNYLIFMGSTTAFLWGLFIFVINLINPNSTNWLGFVIFYLALFLALSGTAALVGFFIRFKLLRQDMAVRVVKTAFRQSFLFSFLVAAILFLLSQKLFSWFNLILLVVILSIIEFLLISSNKK
jgi:hypothetical protein